MLSELINWGHVAENARYGRASIVEHLLNTYQYVDSWCGDDSGEDVHLYHSPWGVIVLVFPNGYNSDDDDDDVPDPWSDAYRAELRALVDGGEFYASFQEAAAQIREMGATAGAVADLLPVLDGYSKRPPDSSDYQW